MIDNDTYKEILENMDEGVYFVDLDRRILYWNHGAERISGYTASRVQGRFCHDNILNHVTENGTSLCNNGCPLHATMQDGNPRQAEIYLHHSEGHLVPIIVRTSPLRDKNGVIIGGVETFSDNSKIITFRRQVRRLEDAALRDHLTRIGNRRYMERRLQSALLDFKQFGTPFGILFMDIDKFKSFNDTHGHKVGDHVLTMVANTLENYLRSEDAIARWGGEEFVALLKDVTEAGLNVAAEKLSLLIAHSAIRVDGQTLRVTISIGASLVRPGDTLESLIERADAAMYQAKRAKAEPTGRMGIEDFE